MAIAFRSALLTLLVLAVLPAGAGTVNTGLAKSHSRTAAPVAVKNLSTTDHYFSIPWGHPSSQPTGCAKVRGCQDMSGDALLLTASADAFDFLTPTQVATGTQIRVQDAAGLAAALKAATGGETIVLAAGDYGRLVIDGRYAETVTLLSDPAAPAVIRSLDIRGAAHVTLYGVLLD